jgi:hypothetical protein
MALPAPTNPIICIRTKSAVFKGPPGDASATHLCDAQESFHFSNDGSKTAVISETSIKLFDT